MIKLSWTALVDDPTDPAGPRTDRQELWRSLLGKAENPLDYVPAITQCRVLERDGEGFLREILRNGERLVQRVTTPEPGRRILFSHVGDPEVASIANVVGEDEQGRLTFTIEVELAPGGVEKCLAESGFLRGTEEYFTGTLAAIVAALRPLAAAAAGPG
jgi:hypothetical protein